MSVYLIRNSWGSLARIGGNQAPFSSCATVRLRLKGLAKDLASRSKSCYTCVDSTTNLLSTPSPVTRLLTRPSSRIYAPLREASNTAATRAHAAKIAAKGDKMAAKSDKMAAIDDSVPGRNNEMAPLEKNNMAGEESECVVAGFKSRVSHLYVPSHLANFCAALLVPYLDFDSKFSDLPKLVAELNLRGVALDLDTLEALKQHWEEFRVLKNEVENEEDLLSTAQKSLKDMEHETELAKNLENKISDSIARLKNLKPRLNQLESTIVPALLDLPNTLRESPYQPGEIIVSKHPPPVFKSPPKPHALLQPSGIEFLAVSPGAFFFSGDVAECEMLLDEYCSTILDEQGYLRQCNPDFAKGVVVEGCGYAPLQKLKVAGSSSDTSPLYLVGGASLPAYLGYFAKQAVKKTSKFLPQKVFSCQRVYVPLKNEISHPDLALNSTENSSLSSAPPEVQSSDVGLPGTESTNAGLPGTEPSNSVLSGGVFSSMQSTSVSMLIASTGESTSENQVVKDVVDIVTSAYENLGLHFRLVRSPYEDLRRYEKDALSIQMLTTTRVNTENTTHNSSSYVEVGRISVIGDYISKRLLMLYVRDGAPSDTPSSRSGRGCTDQTYAPLHLVYAELMNVSRFIAVALESLQDERGGAHLREYLQSKISPTQGE